MTFQSFLDKLSLLSLVSSQLERSFTMSTLEFEPLQFLKAHSKDPGDLSTQVSDCRWNPVALKSWMYQFLDCFNP